MPKPRAKYVRAWERFRRDRSMYFVYPPGANTDKLVASGKYGVVQLICVNRTVQQAFKAGFNAGRRSAGRDAGDR